MKSLNVSPIVKEYGAVLDVLSAGSFWSRAWALRQYVGLVITAMCVSTVGDTTMARRYAVLRVMEIFLEHRCDFFPRTEGDRDAPRNRVALLSIPGLEAECEKWVDILEYMQIRNWIREGIPDETGRTDTLRSRIITHFSEDLMDEIDAQSKSWWLT